MPGMLEQVAHELRTPLTAIQACCEILVANPDLPMDERQRFLSAVLRESRRLNRLVNTLLTNTIDRPGGLPEPVDLGAVAAEAVEACRPLFLERQVALVTDLPDQPLILQGDRDRLTQLVINLLANALNVCENRAGRVCLRLCRADDGQLELMVGDNGPGVPESEQDRIFEPFQRIAGNTGTGIGTGLGLPICREIVEAHHGTIGVERHHATGALFRCLFPASTGLDDTTRQRPGGAGLAGH